jgi:SAM-dependent methyltransferase
MRLRQRAIRSAPSERGRRRPLHDLHQAFNARAYAFGLWARLLRRKATDKRAIDRYLARHAVRRLQLGTGPNVLSGWLNTDIAPDTYPELRERIVFLDATRPFPLGDMTIDYIFSEHQLEHISEAGARSMFSESFRVLRPGGRIRIATPDLSALLQLHAEKPDPLAEHYLEFMTGRFIPKARGNPACQVINHMFYAHGHRFIYDFETLSALVADVGFVGIVRCKPGESRDPVLGGLEAHGRAIGDEDVNRFETMVLEATLPPS